MDPFLFCWFDLVVSSYILVLLVQCPNFSLLISPLLVGKYLQCCLFNMFCRLVCCQQLHVWFIDTPLFGLVNLVTHRFDYESTKQQNPKKIWKHSPTN